MKEKITFKYEKEETKVVGSGAFLNIPVFYGLTNALNGAYTAEMKKLDKRGKNPIKNLELEVEFGFQDADFE